MYEDVKSCPYEDVHVLWSILVESNTSLPSKNGAHMQPVDRIWESFSYLHFPFLSSPAVYINIFDIYEVYTHIKELSFLFLFFWVSSISLPSSEVHISILWYSQVSIFIETFYLALNLKEPFLLHVLYT